MAKQLQLRRGSYLENETFIGAEAEMIFDTERKDIRIHDGVKRGGYMVDTLVDFQIPTAENGYTWYRKYASGWVEQGGIFQPTTSTTSATISVPIPMANNNYNVYLTTRHTGTGTSNWRDIYTQKTDTSFRAGSDGGAVNFGFDWLVSGIAA